MRICSPGKNDPDTCLSVTKVELLPALTAYPVAPLLLPLIREVAGSSIPTAWFKVN